MVLWGYPRVFLNGICFYCEGHASPHTISFAASRYVNGICEAWPSVPRVQGGREERK